MSKAHAKLSASGSSQWLNCTGSIRASADVIDEGSSFAQEGTCAHEVGDLCLKNKQPASDYIGKVVEGVEVTEEMAEYVQGYVDYVLSFGGEQFYEEKVDFSNWVPEGFGTSDAIVMDEVSNTLHVIDLKYGKGVVVDAENNTQGMLYALGAYSDFSLVYAFDSVVIHIYQPRVSNFSTWEVSVKDLLEWADNVVRPKADEAMTDDAPRTPGAKQCQWCKVKATCPALYDHTNEVIVADFDTIEDTLPSPSTLNDAQLRVVLDNKKLIESWLQAVEDHTRRTVESGESFSGYKLVAGRSLRKFRDLDEAEAVLSELLGDDAYEHKLLTVAKAEKALGAKRKKEIGDLIIKPEGKPVLVPDSDKRASLTDCSDDFETCS